MIEHIPNKLDWELPKTLNSEVSTSHNYNFSDFDNAGRYIIEMFESKGPTTSDDEPTMRWRDISSNIQSKFECLTLAHNATQAEVDAKKSELMPKILRLFGNYSIDEIVEKKTELIADIENQKSGLRCLADAVDASLLIEAEKYKLSSKYRSDVAFQKRNEEIAAKDPNQTVNMTRPCDFFERSAQLSLSSIEEALISQLQTSQQAQARVGASQGLAHNRALNLSDRLYRTAISIDTTNELT